MDLTELQHLEDMETRLRAWDWLADLRADERSIPWLARKTGKSERSVYAYSYGQSTPTLAWLRDAYRALKGRG